MHRNKILTDQEYRALRSLKNNYNIIIKSVYKGSVTSFVDRYTEYE